VRTKSLGKSQGQHQGIIVHSFLKNSDQAKKYFDEVLNNEKSENVNIDKQLAYVKEMLT